MERAGSGADLEAAIGFAPPPRILTLTEQKLVDIGSLLVSLFGSVAKTVLHGSGYYDRRLAADVFPGPLVLCYHAVLPDDVDRRAIPFAPLQVSARRFEQQCKAIRQTSQALSLDQFKRVMNGEGEWPARPVLITFDDGY